LLTFPHNGELFIWPPPWPLLLVLVKQRPPSHCE
jgi:hypothetical protein